MQFRRDRLNLVDTFRIIKDVDNLPFSDFFQFSHYSLTWQQFRLLGECANFSDTFNCYSRFKNSNGGQLRDHQFLTLVYQCLNGVSTACFVDVFSINSD